MDTIELNGKKYVIDYSFYSMCLLEDLELGDLDEINKKPLKALSLGVDLLYAVVNKDNGDKEYAIISKSEVRKMLSEWIEEHEGEFTDLLTKLMDGLVNSGFFRKMFQQTTETTLEKKIQE